MKYLFIVFFIGLQIANDKWCFKPLKNNHKIAQDSIIKSIKFYYFYEGKKILYESYSGDKAKKSEEIEVEIILNKPFSCKLFVNEYVQQNSANELNPKIIECFSKTNDLYMGYTWGVKKI